ncbi:phosphatidate cytidylyltransferase [Candidatus Saccharibacteria bacterium]|nr:phosphatidate cytidylyltransferase [Candidatus Saccharibacteria bacterium]
MKGRLIGAVWIIVALCICYFGWNGEYFAPLFLVCFILAAAEICSVVYGESWRMEPLACLPNGAWALELLVLFYASFIMLLIGHKELALVVLVSIASDVGAFACGKLIGKHRVYALHSISPKKTWEGYIGGIVTGWIIGFIVCKLLGIAITPGIIVFLVLGGFMAEIGDLLGSATKRQLGVKDSGEVLSHYAVVKWLEWPVKGHGGYLDRVDSISLCVVLYALINLAS